MEQKNKKLHKSALLTDIHFGAKSNSVQHNEDCINYLNWFCDNVRKDPDIDHILFLGDWNQERSAIDILTLNYSQQGAELLNNLDMPVFFILGNHDLYHRHSRDVHSIVHFEHLNNFVPIYEPTVIPNIGDAGILLCPYLFHEEYPSLIKYTDIPFWAGHFEFKGFTITGYNTKMMSGPDPKDFTSSTILSGHFHKRQTEKNITYIGNTFPTNFGDAGDFDRGMATYNHTSSELLFIDWPDCPKYISTNISTILDGNIEIPRHSRVKCVVDIPLDYSESTELRQTLIKQHELRLLNMEESVEIQEALTETDVDDDIINIEAKSTNAMVCEMLGGIKTDHIDSDMLVDIYQNLQVEEHD